MPGAWELNPYSVLVEILHTDFTSIAWAFGLRTLQLPPGSKIIGLSGMPFAMARNQGAMHALEIGASHLFCFDSDILAPPDTVMRLLAHNLPICSGMYCRRSPPWSVPVAIKNGRWLEGFKPGSLVEVDVVGAGCLLIRRDVLENMPPQRQGSHWFSWQVNYKGSPGWDDKVCMSEDFTFCAHAKKTLGISTYVDTSIQCQHLGLASATHGMYKPLDLVPIP